MTYFLCALPILIVVILVLSGRVPPIGAGLCGLLAAVGVAITLAPRAMMPIDVLVASLKGLWSGWLVGAVIFAGLYFRETTLSEKGEPEKASSDDPLAQRQKVFDACFLIGPFAEAATGFGVGQVATVAVLRIVNLAPIHVVLLALFSQSLVPWGAMANGTVVGAQIAGLHLVELGWSSALLTMPLLIVWLAAFWRIASAAGLAAPPGVLARELACIAIAAGLLITANLLFGPEIAAMAALGPIILARFWRGHRPDRQRWLWALRLGLPYALLTVCLATSRGFSALYEWLASLAAMRPFADAPTWFPMLHPSSWLLVVGTFAACLAGRRSKILVAAGNAWSQGRKPVLTIGVYLVVAQVMADAGTARALAEGLRLQLGPISVLATPLLAGTLGFLTGSSNAANGLLMRSQASLADSHTSLVWIAAIQNTASAALTMLSPARVAMGCALIGRPDLERVVYGRAWPFGAAALAVLTAAAGIFLIAQ